MGMPIARWRRLRLTAMAMVGGLVVFAAIGWWIMIRMPGDSFSGPPPALETEQRGLAEQLQRDVQALAGTIGERNLTRGNLAEAAQWVEWRMSATGREVQSETFEASGRRCRNLFVEVPGSSDDGQIVVIGAHYDSVIGAPGANDNGSGVAALLALLEAFSNEPQAKTLRFVAFANEEPPYFMTENMGSLVHAKRARARNEAIEAMISLETMGYFSTEPDSQRYPFPLGRIYPSTGNFIGFVSDLGSRWLARRAIGAFREHATVPSEGAALPRWVPGVGWSDHWAFWQHGYSAIMVTDTAPFRDPHYHTARDTPDKLDYESLARVVEGLQPVIRRLARDG